MSGTSRAWHSFAYVCVIGRVFPAHILGWPIGYGSRYSASREDFLNIVTVKEGSAIVLIRLRCGFDVVMGEKGNLKLRKKRRTYLLDKTFCESVSLSCGC